jgi:hypothetical protein
MRFMDGLHLFDRSSEIAEADLFVFFIIGTRWLGLFDVVTCLCFNGPRTLRTSWIGKRRSRRNRKTLFVDEKARRMDVADLAVGGEECLLDT